MTVAGGGCSCRAGFALNCLPSPSPDAAGKGVLQGAEFISRTEGLKTLKLWHSPHFLVSRIYSCFGDLENDLTLWWLNSPLLRKFVLVTAHVDLQVSCALRMMPSTVGFSWGFPWLVSTPAGPRNSPVTAVVLPCSCRFCSPSISFFLPCTGFLFLLPHCTCTAGKRQKESDLNVGKAHARKCRNPARGGPLRLSDGD